MNPNVSSSPATIEVGRRVRHYGAHMHTQEGVIVSVHGTPGLHQDQKIGGIMTVINNQACRFDVITFDGWRYQCRESNIGRQSIGRIDLLDRVHGQAMIEMAERLVEDRKAAEAKQNAEAAIARAAAIEKIKAENPDLLKINGYGGAAHAAKNIRIEFKKAGIKAVSIRSKSYSGGDSINVTMPHDATDEQVEAAKKIANKYQGGHFNGMEDIYEYSSNPWTEVFGDAKYVFVQRDWNNGGEA